MKLLVNNSSTYKGGSEQVALSFIYECRKYPQHEFYVVTGENLSGQIEKNKFPENFNFYTLQKRPASGAVTFFKTIIWLKNLENKVKPDCVIATGGHGYSLTKAPLVAGFNIPHYLYPESPYFSQISLRKKLYWKIRKQIELVFFRQVDAYLVQTDDVNKRVRKLMESNNVYTVSNTVNGHFYDYDLFPNKLPERKPGEVRLLTLSSYYPHKNLEIINLVLKKLIELDHLNIRFVLTIPDKIFKSKFDEDIRKHIYNLGQIPIEECPSLYQEIDFMFLPTLLECFSASYAEAMVMKKPILTSDLGFAHTVCKDAAVYFDPMDPEDIARKIISLINDKNKQISLVEKGTEISSMFNTPEERAKKFLSICEMMQTDE